MSDETVIKDGFDTLTFPCEYAFKAMCNVLHDTCAENTVTEKIGSVLNKDKIHKTRSRLSKNKKYIAVTVLTTVENRQQLEKVYQKIRAIPFVVMIL